MTEADFQKEVIDRLSHLEKGINIMKQEMDIIKEKVIDDTVLTDEDKVSIGEALQEEKEGKLLSKDKVFD